MNYLADIINHMITSYENLPNIRKKFQNKKIVLGSGVFDLLHIGHVKYLQNLKKYGDIVVVLVKSDERVRKNKDPRRPIIPEGERVELVAALSGVDFAFIGPWDQKIKAKVDQTYEAVFSALKPDVFVTSNPTWRVLGKLGNIKVVIEPRMENGIYLSTTDIINSIDKSAGGFVK